MCLVVSFAGVFHSGNYGPPVGFCFDQYCQDDPMMDDPLLADYNVERRASEFADACQVHTYVLSTINFCRFNGLFCVFAAKTIMCIHFPLRQGFGMKYLSGRAPVHSAIGQPVVLRMFQVY